MIKNLNICVKDLLKNVELANKNIISFLYTTEKYQFKSIEKNCIVCLGTKNDCDCRKIFFGQILVKREFEANINLVVNTGCEWHYYNDKSVKTEIGTLSKWQNSDIICLKNAQNYISEYSIESSYYSSI